MEEEEEGLLLFGRMMKDDKLKIKKCELWELLLVVMNESSVF
jgi:hypothetical protein